MTTLLLTIIFFNMENPLTFWWEEEDKTLGHHRHNVMRISWPSESDTKQAQQINAIMKNERLYNVIWLLLKRMHIQRVLVTRVYGRWYLLLLNNCLINVSILLKQLRNTSKGIYWFVTLIKPSWNVQSYTIWIHYFISGLG